MQPTTFPTRILVASDTHGMTLEAGWLRNQAADVAIHCGDLTDGSKLDEFRTTLQILKEIKAPLKLVVPGNHDFTLDVPAFERIVAESAVERELIEQAYGKPGEVRRIFDEASDAGIVLLLDEGTYSYELDNGAKLTVFATPWTPTRHGNWGFQFSQEEGHCYDIKKGTDIAITHGPPMGILDKTNDGRRAGCPGLFAAIAQAKPRVHCFGHIHEGWGATVAHWRPELSENPSHFTDIDNNQSKVLENLARLRPSKFDTPADLTEKKRRLQSYERAMCCESSHCEGDEFPLGEGKTLFVNASLSGSEDMPVQMPWLVDIELPRSDYK